MLIKPKGYLSQRLTFYNQRKKGIMTAAAQALEWKATSMDEIRSSINVIGDLLSHGRELMYGEEIQSNPEKTRITEACQGEKRGPQMGTSYLAFAGKQGNHSTFKHKPTLFSTQRTHTKGEPLEPTKTASKNDSNAAVASAKHFKSKKSPSVCTNLRQGTSTVKKTLLLMGVEQIAQARMEGKKVPSIEVGITDDDTVQDGLSLKELKSRVRREMEEYFRNTPMIFKNTASKGIALFKNPPTPFNSSVPHKATGRPTTSTNGTSIKIKESQRVLPFRQRSTGKQLAVAHNGCDSIRKQMHGATPYGDKSNGQARRSKKDQAQLPDKCNGASVRINTSSNSRRHVSAASTEPDEHKPPAAAQHCEGFNPPKRDDIPARHRALVTPLRLDMLRM